MKRKKRSARIQVHPERILENGLLDHNDPEVIAHFSGEYLLHNAADYASPCHFYMAQCQKMSNYACPQFSNNQFVNGYSSRVAQDALTDSHWREADRSLTDLKWREMDYTTNVESLLFPVVISGELWTSSITTYNFSAWGKHQTVFLCSDKLTQQTLLSTINEIRVPLDQALPQNGMYLAFTTPEVATDGVLLYAPKEHRVYDFEGLYLTSWLDPRDQCYKLTIMACSRPERIKGVNFPNNKKILSVFDKKEQKKLITKKDIVFLHSQNDWYLQFTLDEGTTIEQYIEMHLNGNAPMIEEIVAEIKQIILSSPLIPHLGIGDILRYATRRPLSLHNENKKNENVLNNLLSTSSGERAAEYKKILWNRCGKQSKPKIELVDFMLGVLPTPLQKQLQILLFKFDIYTSMVRNLLTITYNFIAYHAHAEREIVPTTKIKKSAEGRRQKRIMQKNWKTNNGYTIFRLTKTYSHSSSNGYGKKLQHRIEVIGHPHHYWVKSPGEHEIKGIKEKNGTTYYKIKRWIKPYEKGKQYQKKSGVTVRRVRK